MIKPAVLDAMVAAGCTAEQIAAAVKADQASSSGAARQARYRARKASNSDDSDVTSVTERNTDVTPLSPKEIPPTPPKEITPIPVSEPDGSSTVSLETEFEREFWPAYPRKVGKGQALKAFRTVRKRGVPLETIMGGVRRYAAERQGEDANFTKHAATWLNGICWEDEPASAPRRTATGPPQDDFNSILDGYINGSRYDVHPQPDHSFDAGNGGSDRRSAQGVVQLHALPSRR